MGLPMTGNLKKNGFDVRAFDLNPKTLAKCEELVSLATSLLILILIGSNTSKEPVRCFKRCIFIYIPFNISLNIIEFY